MKHPHLIKLFGYGLGRVFLVLAKQVAQFRRPCLWRGALTAKTLPIDYVPPHPHYKLSILT